LAYSQVYNRVMKALLLATGYHSELEPLISYRPSPLLNMVDKPIIFHIIEALVKQEIRQIHLILHHCPEQIEHCVGNGDRWGISIEYHLTKDSAHPFKSIKPVAANWNDSPLLIGSADHLPQLPLLQDLKKKTPAFFFENATWTGWGIVPALSLSEIPGDLDSDTLPHYFPNHIAIPAKAFLSCRNFPELIAGNQMLISSEMPEALFPTTAKNVESGIWISRAVVIEPGAALIPPLFIGENCHIKSGSVIGPQTIIENHSIIDSGSHVEKSLVCQNTYVGEGLEIKQCIVDRNSLINMELKTQLTIHEQFILSGTAPPPFHVFVTAFFERSLALVFIIILLPIYLLMLATCSKKYTQVLQLPASHDQSKWQSVTLTTFHPKNTFFRFFHRLPLLIDVINGKLHFVGVAPRTIKNVEGLPHDWKSLYLKSKIGLVTLARIDYGDNATVDEQYASEVFYSVHMGGWFDFKQILRWMKMKIKKIAV
jgi:NDP-sugar pyrophosphorylase family protein